MKKVIRVENIEISVFGQVVKIAPFELSFREDTDLLQGFETLEKSYEEGAIIYDYVMDNFWDNVYIKGVPKFVDVEQQKEQDRKACNLYLK